jgi:hypothetical protein
VNDKNLKKYLGPIALLSVVSYFVATKNDKDRHPALEGINIDIDTNKIVDSIKEKIKTNPQAQQAIGHAIKGLISGYLAEINRTEDDESDDKVYD